jgi:dipeptidyl aminopeptidase/acylaminoacyl peptidase
VVCSELNHKRQQAEPPLDRITPELLEGADREILSGFYERAMAGLDPRARAFVEDELITDRGFRDSHALEDSLALPGVTAGAIDALTRNRLLRVDERQSVRRLELTHDVLTRVVKESRDHRRAREAEEKALAQQRRNRRNAALVLAGTLVAVVLIALAGLAEWKAQRLLRAAAVTHRMANAERLQDIDLDTALLVNLEALRIAPTLEVRSGLIRRFASHPHTSTFLSEHQDEINNVVFSPDSKLLASASKDQTVILWDVEGSKPLARLQGHTGGVESVAFSPDGKRLASASLDQTVILWDVASRKPLATLQGHQGEVHGVAFSPDGKRLASTSRDGTVILWDVAGREPLVSLADDQGWVRKATFSPDGKQLAAASENHTVLVWDLDALLDLDFLKAEACRRANRNLTCDEWEIYIGDDEPYHKACEALPGPERCE